MPSPCLLTLTGGTPSGIIHTLSHTSPPSSLPRGARLPRTSDEARLKELDSIELKQALKDVKDAIEREEAFNWITLKNMFITGEGHERHEQLPGMGSFAPYQSRQLVGLGMGLFSSTSQRIRCQRARLTFYSRWQNAIGAVEYLSARRY